MRNGSVEMKIKVLSSMFPEKIEFDGEKYRTNSYNKVLDLIYQHTNELLGRENEKGEAVANFSNSVPRPAFEIYKLGTILLNRKSKKNKALYTNIQCITNTHLVNSI